MRHLRNFVDKPLLDGKVDIKWTDNMIEKEHQADFLSFVDNYDIVSLQESFMVKEISIQVILITTFLQ